MLTKLASIKSAVDFGALTRQLNIRIPCDPEILPATLSPICTPLEQLRINGRKLNNRWVIHPMEGWDGTLTGGITDDTRRRWLRFGQSGAKLLFGGEAMAVRPDGRANPNQLILQESNRKDFQELIQIARDAHATAFGQSEDLVIGFQLTHSGRFCKPQKGHGWQPRVAFRHPLLDERFNVVSDDQVWIDEEIDDLIQDYIKAARLAYEVGADFIDIKHCHGYLLHEFLGAHTRPGRYGGSFENRTRILRTIVQGIRKDQNPIDIAVRLSAFDFVPFIPDASKAEPGKLGPGMPMPYADHLPYEYAFGINRENPVEYDLTETFEFMRLASELGVKLLNLTAGSPYYNPHIQRPAAYPPSDGYQPPEDPLIGVARQLDVVRQLATHKPSGMALIGSAYSYLQEFLPQVAQAVIREGWVDLVGIGRMVLSYPDLLRDATEKRVLTKKLICRTFSDCTTAPRNGLRSGCYPLDHYYLEKPEAAELKAIKKNR